MVPDQPPPSRQPSQKDIHDAVTILVMRIDLTDQRRTTLIDEVSSILTTCAQVYQESSPKYAHIATPDSSQSGYEEGTETLTRPRLTKEQLYVLETQFQAHPKPNSMVKRQLAMQTKLTLPRVAVCSL